MGYKSLEDRILGLSEEEKIDIDKVQTAFSEGADPNAVERNGSDRMMDWDTLFGDCVRYNYYEHANLVELLECFLRNGLDVDLLGSLILSAFVCMNNQDMYRLAQMILGRMKAGSAVEDALEKIRMVLFSRTGVTDVAERGQNDLYGLYRLIRAYQRGQPFDGFKMLTEQIGQPFCLFCASGEIIEADQTKLLYRISGEQDDFAAIRMADDSLIIENGAYAYLNDRHQIRGTPNAFSDYVNRSFEGKTVWNVEFGSGLEQSPYCQLERGICVSFSDGRKLVFYKVSAYGEGLIEIAG